MISGFDDSTIGTFDVLHFGSVPVSKPKGDELADAAFRTVKDSAPKKSKVMVTATRISIEAGGTTVHDAPIEFVSFCGLLGKVDKKAFAYITHCDGKSTCHLFRTAGKTKPHDVPTAISDAFQLKSGGGQTAVPRRRMSKKEEDRRRRSSLLGQIVASRKGFYAGSMPLESSSGQNAEQVMKQQGMVKGDPCELFITSTHLEIQHSARLALVASDPLPEVVLVGCSSDYRTVVSYTTKNPEGLGYICHVFRLQNASDADFVLAKLTKVLTSTMNELKANPTHATRFRRRNSVQMARMQGGTTWELELLGSFPQQQGIDKADLVAESLRAADKNKKTTKVSFAVTPDGLRVVDQESSEVQSDTSLPSITYTMQCGKKNEMLAVINKNAMIGLKTCRVYRSASSAQVIEVLSAIQEGCKKAAAQAFLNPFAAKEASGRVPEALAPLEINRGLLRSEKVIGAGQYGRVYLGEYTKGSTKLKVAVKMLKSAASSLDTAAFVDECSAMNALRHKNLCGLIGCAAAQKPWMLVIEFMQYGDLQAIMLRCKDKNIQLTTTEHLGFTVQVLAGLDFMASMQYIHMDIAARNMLVGPQNVVKVGDFGLARWVGDSGVCMLEPGVAKLPMKWMSPESMDLRKFSESSDVWSFGVMWWEQFAYGVEPFDGIVSKDIQTLVREGLRLGQPADCPDDVFALMAQCWCGPRKDRPTFATLLKQVRQLFAGLMTTDTELRDVAAEIIDKVKRKISASSIEYGFGDLLDDEHDASGTHVEVEDGSEEEQVDEEDRGMPEMVVAAPVAGDGDGAGDGNAITIDVDVPAPQPGPSFDPAPEPVLPTAPAETMAEDTAGVAPIAETGASFTGIRLEVQADVDDYVDDERSDEDHSDDGASMERPAGGGPEELASFPADNPMAIDVGEGSNMFARYFATVVASGDDDDLEQMLQSADSAEGKELHCYAPIFDLYENYGDTFDAMLRKYHDTPDDWEPTTTVDFSKGEATLNTPIPGIDEFNVRVKIARNFVGLPTSAAMSQEERVALEDQIAAACDTMSFGGQAGEHCSRTPGHAKEADPVTQEEFITDHHLFAKPQEMVDLVTNPGIASDWPHGRGCFVSGDERMSMQIGGHNHLTMVYQDRVKSLADLIAPITSVLEEIEASELPDFRKSPRFGNLTTEPSKVGTGFELSVTVDIPEGVLPEVERRCRSLNLDCTVERSVNGRSTIALTNRSTFGISEGEILLSLYDGVGAVIKAAAAAGDYAHQPPGVREDDVGKRVMVRGYDLPGTLKFFGNHATKGSPRCGVAFPDATVGDHDGTVDGTRYFECAGHGCGILVVPRKVTLLAGTARAASPPSMPGSFGVAAGLASGPQYSATKVKNWSQQRGPAKKDKCAIS